MLAATFWATYSWELAALAFLLLGSAFFSGSETALFTLSHAQRQRFSESTHWFHRLTAKLLKRPNRLLNTLLLGNMIVNVGFSAVAATLVLGLQNAGKPAWQIAAASLAPLLTVILLGEVTPKMLAFSVAKPWATLCGPVLYALEVLLKPLLWILEKSLVNPITKILAPHAPEENIIRPEELSALMAISADRGVIDADAGDMIREIMELTDVKAGDIMVPRVDFLAYDIEDGNAGLIELFRDTHLRKLPVYENDIDNILGVIHAKNLLMNPQAKLRELVQPLIFLPQTADLEKVLRRFRKTHRQMAIVVDEYGGTAGLITLEDVLEEIVGDIPDLHEAEAKPLVQKTSKTQYILSGDLSIRNWAEAFQMEPVVGRISTLGGLVTKLMKHIPAPGETVNYRNLRFTIKSMRGRRVESIRLDIIGGDA